MLKKAGVEAEITTDAGNEPSRKVVLANGARLVEEFVAAQYGATRTLRFAIDLV